MQDTGFYKIETLWTNRALFKTLCAMFTVTFLLWGGIAAYLQRATVPVDKIANVAWLDSAVAEQFKNFAKPISEISNVAGTGGPILLAGWASDVKNVCALGAVNKTVILLAQQGDGFAAVTTKLDSEACRIFSNQVGSKAVWAVSDDPFMTVDSKPAYVLLNGPVGFDNSLLRLRH